ncbi:AraC family transcriptional regulator [Rhodococcus indonesiensis]|uniref:AraC family transcriptional regulator n=1 Tax=Rhodococcus indonesiensis TaxID=3055869 RepID=UPI0039F65FA1
MSVIRGSVLAGYREFVAELGADPDTLLCAAGLRPADAGNHEVFIAYRSHIRAVETAATATGTPDFGRQLAARRQGIEILGPLGVALRTAATVADALAIAAKYLSVYGPAIAVSIEPNTREGQAFYEFRILMDRLPPHPQTLELALGVSLKVFRFLLGPQYRPLAVHFPHRPLTGCEEYLSYFGSAVHFQQSRAGFTLRTGDLARPLSHDPTAHQAIQLYLDTVIPDGASDPLARAAELIRRLLPTGVTVEMIAAQFAMHPRTLQRRLEMCGLTFTHLVDDARRGVAERYLRDTDLSLSHISRELGYSEQSVFTRACQRWFGAGPRAYRRQLRGDDAHSSTGGLPWPSAGHPRPSGL